MATIHKVSAARLDATPDRPRRLSAREARRQALERALGRAITGAHENRDTAYKLILEADDKQSTVRLAFNRTKARLGAADVNLLAADGGLWIAKRPQRRGRRAGSVVTRTG